MSIPTPPSDASGGFIVVKYTNGTSTHRLRVHVLPFNADSTGSYVTPPTGGEASVSATFTALCGFLQPFMNTGFTMSLDAVFRRDPSSGNLVEVFTVTPPATVAGTNATAASRNEMYEVFVMRTTGGHPFRIFVFQRPNAAIGAPTVATPNAAGDNNQKLCAYLQASTTAVVGHDGNKPVGNVRVIDGANKRLRRKQGDA